MTTTETNTAATAINTADFIFFEGAASESSSRPRITLRKGGLLILTAATAAMLGETVESVQLAFNSKTGAVGIRAAAPGTPGSYRLRHQMKGNGRQITGKRFFEHHGLDLNFARSFGATDFGGGIIGFLLEVKPATVPTEAAAAAQAPAPIKVKPAANRPARKAA